MKIRFVQLESQAFLTDLDFVGFSAAERGVYCTLILQLYCSGGKCEFDPPVLERLCNCENFEQIWERIGKKFQTRSGVIKHKRVTKEMQKARKFAQRQRAAGLASARKRQPRLNHGSTTVQPTKTKGNVIEKESKLTTNTNSCEQAPSSSSSVRDASSSAAGEGLHFHEALNSIIRPRSQSDRTCFRNVTNWLTAGCASRKFNSQIFARALDLAREATTGKNPAAVFMVLMKKELRYKNGRERYC